MPADLNYFDGVVSDGDIYSSAHDLSMNIWHEAIRDSALVPNHLF